MWYLGIYCMACSELEIGMPPFNVTIIGGHQWLSLNIVGGRARWQPETHWPLKIEHSPFMSLERPCRWRFL